MNIDQILQGILGCARVHDWYGTTVIVADRTEGGNGWGDEVHPFPEKGPTIVIARPTHRLVR